MTAAPPAAPPIVEVLRALLRRPAALDGGLAPLVAGAAIFVRNLQALCPETFDERGALRPDWRAAAQAALDGGPIPAFPAAPVASPVIHAHLATRRIQVHLN